MIIAPLRRNVNYPSGISAPTEMPFDILKGAGGVQLHSTLFSVRESKISPRATLGRNDKAERFLRCARNDRKKRAQRQCLID